MQGKRTDRVGHLIQMELSNLVLHKIKDPRLGFVTITHVDLPADLRSARVFYSSLGTEKEKKATHMVLQKAAGFLQKEIGSVLPLRNTPKLTFVYDDSLDRGLEIDRTLRALENEKKS